MTETFCVRLVRLRQRDKKTQGELAQRVGMGQSEISMLEAGERCGENMRVKNALALAAALGVSVEYLVTGIGRVRGRSGRAMPQGMVESVGTM